MIFLLLLFSSGGFAVTYVAELTPGINPVQYALSHGVTYMGATEVNPDLHIFESTTTNRLKMTRDVTWLEEQVPRQRHRRQEEDPLRGEQWHLNQIELPENCPYTGAGVTIGVVDDG